MHACVRVCVCVCAPYYLVMTAGTFCETCFVVVCTERVPVFPGGGSRPVCSMDDVLQALLPATPGTLWTGKKWLRSIYLSLSLSVWEPFSIF